MPVSDVETLWEMLARTAVDLGWLRESVEQVAKDPAVIGRFFAAAGRKVGRGELAADEGQWSGWTIDDAARVLLLAANPERSWALADRLYEEGDSNERRGVLRALAFLPDSDAGLGIVRDALRGNEAPLVGAALSEYGVERLPADELNHAVVKCVFVEFPLTEVADLSAHANPELALMLAKLVEERVAAGRTVAADVWPLIDAFPPTQTLAAVEAELESDVPARREAAASVLADRAASHGRMQA